MHILEQDHMLQAVKLFPDISLVLIQVVDFLKCLIANIVESTGAHVYVTYLPLSVDPH